MFFLSLPGAEVALARVAGRVRQGGHHISEDVIRRRYSARLNNLEKLSKPALDSWAKKFDNEGGSPILLQWRERP